MPSMIYATCTLCLINAHHHCRNLGTSPKIPLFHMTLCLTVQLNLWLLGSDWSEMQNYFRNFGCGVLQQPFLDVNCVGLGKLISLAIFSIEQLSYTFGIQSERPSTICSGAWHRFTGFVTHIHVVVHPLDDMRVNCTHPMLLHIGTCKSVQLEHMQVIHRSRVGWTCCS